MTKLTEATKREITKDWAACFPSLGVYKPLWLMRRVGPLLEGICLNRDSSNERYQPIFHVHNLAREDSALSFTLAEELRTVRNGTPEKVRVAFHKDHYVDVAKRICAQALLPLEGDLELRSVVAAYRNYTQRPLAKYPVNLYEDLITILLWCGREGEAKEVLANCLGEMEMWPPSVASLQRVGGVEKWEQKCSAWIQNRRTVRATVEQQIQAHGVADLPTAAILF